MRVIWHAEAGLLWIGPKQVKQVSSGQRGTPGKHGSLIAYARWRGSSKVNCAM